MTISVTKKMNTETGHRLINYDGKCAHLHGHTYRWEVTVVQDDLVGIDHHTGMVADLKEVMKEVIGPFDHAFVLCEHDPLLNMPDEDIDETFMASNGDKGNLIVLPFNPTAENLLRFVSEGLEDQFKKRGLHLDRIKVWETEDSYAEMFLPSF